MNDKYSPQFVVAARCPESANLEVKPEPKGSGDNREFISLQSRFEGIAIRCHSVSEGAEWIVSQPSFRDSYRGDKARYSTA